MATTTKNRTRSKQPSKSSRASSTTTKRTPKREPIATEKETTPEVKSTQSSDKGIYIAAIITFTFAILLLGAIISYFYSWEIDQSINSMSMLIEFSQDMAQNSTGKFGAIVAHFLVGNCFGIFAICIPFMVAAFSMILFKIESPLYRKSILSLLILMIIGSVAAAYLFPNLEGIFGSSLGGAWGYYIYQYGLTIIGEFGLGVIIFALFAIWMIYTSLTVVKYMGRFITGFFTAIGKILLAFPALFNLFGGGNKKRAMQTEQTPTYEIVGDEIALQDQPEQSEDSDQPLQQDDTVDIGALYGIPQVDPMQYQIAQEAPMPHTEEQETILPPQNNSFSDENSYYKPTILTEDYSQTILDKNNMIIFNAESSEDDMVMSVKEQEPTAQEQVVEQVQEDVIFEIREVETKEEKVAESEDLGFEIDGIYSNVDEIKEEEFEVAITSNAELDIKDIPEGENIKIITNETHELDEIDNSVFDPTLELSKYKLPPVDLLDNHTSKVVVTEEELYENKNRILETLKNFNIAIDKIKATIGPTVTLYEIKPAAGVRISKIKNLEDDIALSLSALGIRIIAPIPGKGTIGIEVPNKNKETVSMYSVIKSAKFQDTKYDLPVVLGRTIQNDDFVIDLAKMPHLLVAGATGQGKSVGLNAIIASLLYKKHPAELKFVLVDPKKVELTLYQSIEKHFLAKMEDEEEAIITDTDRVVYTLNSLCIEMDGRYKLLKKAKVRNIKEYNDKFTKRKLNPNNDHRFLPYFVVIIDEFADLIMTAGREIETPIARIAQLARAVGIHLVIATQRPTTNIITGVIKANFPARIAFRVSSMIDSRTILDSPGANQLIGRGDMLVSTGNETVRVQCAFIDTPEVERITDYIGQQRGYPTPYILPDFVPEGNGKSGDSPKAFSGKRDEKFTEVARYVVQNQQGSASTIQRNFAIGFNRAGRLMDQLEKAGIVGKQEGSKPRQVLISDMASLELRLMDIEDNNEF